MLLPALAELLAANRLPDDLELVGVTRDELSDDDFRHQVLAALDEHTEDVDDEANRALAARLTHRMADATDATAVRALFRDAPPTIMYLALPPPLFAPAVEAIADCDLPAGNRIAIEKPFGEDLASARRLNALLERFDERDVYRVDHFLAMPATRNLLALRFANRLFEPTWRAEHIERIEITWDETLALEGRAGYYDRAGALRDMIQNHLIALLSVATMDRPGQVTGEEFRSARVDLLRSIRAPADDELPDATMRARYGAGDGRPAYVDEEGVEPGRNTETLARINLSSDQPRWSGVPFVLRAGKALARDNHELLVEFRRPAPMSGAGERPPPSRLRLDLDSSELRLDINAAPPSPSDDPRVELRAGMPTAALTAYASVLTALLEDDHAPFVRADEAEEAWRIVKPVMDAWAEDRVPLEEYAAGTDGPR